MNSRCEVIQQFYCCCCFQGFLFLSMKKFIEIAIKTFSSQIHASMRWNWRGVEFYIIFSWLKKDARDLDDINLSKLICFASSLKSILFFRLFNFLSTIKIKRSDEYKTDTNQLIIKFNHTQRELHEEASEYFTQLDYHKKSIKSYLRPYGVCDAIQQASYLDHK